ncbi:MAG: type II toxin-antitoxin system CcdA family antitoxin [Pseudomonadota bacterium]|nr:type II toxin-antitoxin system CcdA family antitoxin [Pseudomonadota bacterium]
MNTVLKKPTNLSLRIDLLEEARALGINLSQALEKALEVEVKKAKEKAWLGENRAAIEAYNHHVEKHGLFSDNFRSFMIEPRNLS